MGEWPIQEPRDLLAVTGGLMLLFGVVAFLFGRFFCARPVPPWTTQWRDIAVALVGARLLGAIVFDLPLDWFSALLWLNMGLSQMAIALYRWQYVFGARGDRCE